MLVVRNMSECVKEQFLGQYSQTTWNQQFNMMHEDLLKLKEELSTVDLLGRVTITTAVVDQMLDSRDSAEFDGQWQHAYQRVAQVEHAQELTAIDAKIILEIRELAFKRAFGLTKHTELAGYVSDDFDLIARALRAGIDDSWINTLWTRYQNGEFPH